MSLFVKVTRCFQRKYLKYPYAVASKTLWEKDDNQTLVITRKVLKNFSAGRNCRCPTCWGTVRNSAPAIKHNLKKIWVRTICLIPSSTLYTLAHLIDLTESITKQKQKHLLFYESSVLHIPFLHPTIGKKILVKEQYMQPGICTSRPLTPLHVNSGVVCCWKAGVIFHVGSVLIKAGWVAAKIQLTTDTTTHKL